MLFVVCFVVSQNFCCIQMFQSSCLPQFASPALVSLKNMCVPRVLVWCMCLLLVSALVQVCLMYTANFLLILIRILVPGVLVLIISNNFEQDFWRTPGGQDSWLRSGESGSPRGPREHQDTHTHTHTHARTVGEMRRLAPRLAALPHGTLGGRSSEGKIGFAALAL